MIQIGQGKEGEGEEELMMEEIESGLLSLHGGRIKGRPEGRFKNSIAYLIGGKKYENIHLLPCTRHCYL